MADSSYSEQASFDTSKYTLQFFERGVSCPFCFSETQFCTFYPI